MNAKWILPNSLQHRKFALLSIILIICFALGIMLDIVESSVHQSSFYLSESALFSFAWLLFLPLLVGQFFLADLSKTKTAYALFVLIPFVLHLFAYPAVVWLISKVFFHHTFSYWQTFNYGLTEYFFVLLIVYSVPFVLYRSFKSKWLLKPKDAASTEQSKQQDLMTTLVVSDSNKRTIIHTHDILFLSANPPYINIHHKTKQYLHNETLKAMLSKLDQSLFVRAHKSTIVNVKMVQSYKSRLNGDYDLTMIDGTALRLSRMYASQFKQKVESTHRVTPE